MAYIYRTGLRNKKNLFDRTSTTLKIIYANILIFFVIYTFLTINQDFIKYFALRPTYFIEGKYVWTIFLSMFSHIYFWHIFANMITLFFIGTFVERLIGKRRYLLFYLSSGVIVSFFFIFLSLLFRGSDLGTRIFGSPDIFALGASGAIFGLAGLITILIPRMKVLAFFVIPMRMWTAMIFFLGFFWILSAFAGLPIANSAHLGGFLVGIIYGLYLKKKYPIKTKRLNSQFT